MDTVRYSSKKDAWLVGLVTFGILFPLFSGVYIFFTGSPRTAWFLLLERVLLGVGLLLLTYPLYYELTPTALKVGCDIFIDRQIPLSAVQKVVPTRNPLSVPAWSLERLRVNYKTADGESFAFVSLADKTRFTADLTRRDGGLELQGERVVRVE